MVGGELVQFVGEGRDPLWRDSPQFAAGNFGGMQRRSVGRCLRLGFLQASHAGGGEGGGQSVFGVGVARHERFQILATGLNLQATQPWQLDLHRFGDQQFAVTCEHRLVGAELDACI